MGRHPRLVKAGVIAQLSDLHRKMGATVNHSTNALSNHLAHTNSP